MMGSDLQCKKKGFADKVIHSRESEVKMSKKRLSDMRSAVNLARQLGRKLAKDLCPSGCDGKKCRLGECDECVAVDVGTVYNVLEGFLRKMEGFTGNGMDFRSEEMEKAFNDLVRGPG